MQKEKNSLFKAYPNYISSVIFLLLVFSLNVIMENIQKQDNSFGITSFNDSNNYNHITYNSYESDSKLTIPDFSTKIEETEGVNSDIITQSASADIVITNDDNFTDYGLPGLGTEIDPYRIENQTINTSNDYGIYIKNTRKFFLIQNCTISAINSGIFISNATSNNFEKITDFKIFNNTCYASVTGIFITQCWYAELLVNRCYDNSINGIYVYSSWYSVISKNTCTKNEHGITIQQSSYLYINENYCTDNQLDGLMLGNSGGTVFGNICIKNSYGLHFGSNFPLLIENNTCLNNSIYGIRLSGSSSSTILNNTCMYNKYGIYNLDSFWSEIRNNTCEFNDYGIFLAMGSWYDIVSFNNCSYNFNVGIFLNKSRSCTILSNILYSNSFYGVSLDETTNNTIVSSNHFIDNHPNGSSQAYDDGYENIWFDAESKVGNFWNDCNSCTSYQIDGKSGSVDLHPNNKSQTTNATSFDLLILSGSLSLICIISYYFIDKKRN